MFVKTCSIDHLSQNLRVSAPWVTVIRAGEHWFEEFDIYHPLERYFHMLVFLKEETVAKPGQLHIRSRTRVSNTFIYTNVLQTLSVCVWLVANLFSKGNHTWKHICKEKQSSSSWWSGVGRGCLASFLYLIATPSAPSWNPRVERPQSHLRWHPRGYRNLVLRWSDPRWENPGNPQSLVNPTRLPQMCPQTHEGSLERRLLGAPLSPRREITSFEHLYLDQFEYIYRDLSVKSSAINSKQFRTSSCPPIVFNVAGEKRHK